MKKQSAKHFLFATMIAALVFGASAFGQEHEAIQPHGIPKVVYYQALNFFGLIILLFVLVKSKVASYFAQRHHALVAALNEARVLREEAEKKHQEYTVKIQNFERESARVLEQIRSEGEEAKRRIIEEARKMSEAIEREAKRTAENEIERAKAELYDDILEEALDNAHAILAKSVAENDQRRLQKEFVEKIEAAQ